MYIHIPQDYMPHTKHIQQLVGAHHGVCYTHKHSIYNNLQYMLCTSSHTVQCNTS